MAASSQNMGLFQVPLGYFVDAIRSNQLYVHHRFEIKAEIPVQMGVTFILEHGVSFTSWGEEIQITLTSTDGYHTNVMVRSECRLVTQIIDWGKNRENVDNVFLFLNDAANRWAYQQQQQYQQQQYQQPQGQPHQQPQGQEPQGQEPQEGQEPQQ